MNFLSKKSASAAKNWYQKHLFSEASFFLILKQCCQLHQIVEERKESHSKDLEQKKVTVTFRSKKFRCANCCQILKKHFLIKLIDLATLFQKRCHYVLPSQIKMTAFKNKVPKSKDIVDDIKDQPFAIRLSFAREADSV